jgi:hypothetical protein
MRQHEFKAFVETLNGLAEHYRQPKPTDFSLRIWWESLRSFELEAVQKAFIAHINLATKDARFFPSVGGIKELLQGSVSDNASQAWTKVSKAVQRVGTGSTVVFDDHLIHAVIDDMGGWIQLGRKETDEWPFVAREFEQRYRALAQREGVEYPPKLVGYFEAHNGQQGHDTDPPVLIGDPERAAQVLAGGSTAARLLITPMASHQPPPARLQ